MNDEQGILVFLGCIVFVCGATIMYICCKGSCRGNDDEPHQSFQDLLLNLRTLVPPSIPVVQFNARGYVGFVDCVICLTQLADKDRIKIFPRCGHLFHVDCINTWLRSHSTCPICRNGLTENQDSVTEPPQSVASTSREVVIDITVER